MQPTSGFYEADLPTQHPVIRFQGESTFCPGVETKMCSYFCPWKKDTATIGILAMKGALGLNTVLVEKILKICI